MSTLPTCAQFVAVLAYRQFGWRLYSKLGVDFREKGASQKCEPCHLPACLPA